MKKLEKYIYVVIALIIGAVLASIVNYVIMDKKTENGGASDKKNTLKDHDIINKLESLFGLVSTYELDNSNMIKNNKYFCTGYSGSCSDLIYQKNVISGKDLNLKFQLYNTMNYLKTYKSNLLSYGKIDSISAEEYSIDLNDNNFYYIKSTDLIDYVNKFYNTNLEKSSYIGINSIQHIYGIDVQGLFLGKVNNEDVYFIYSIDDKLYNEQYPHFNSKYEKNNEFIYLYHDAIYNLEIEYDDRITSISMLDGSNKINVNEYLSNLSYDKYKKYYTSYKITFKENSDGSFSFISAEPQL